ncbi:hypothetical protein QIA00_04700 (plasmid) [Borreliella americana]|uniref:Uncharacterized protein n=1 Tax=Borreliella americana TaxID=478807 RepID=A0ABZ0CDZ4_9SPIR|nr:hypothetical protein [Borreliella americana]WKD01262.1 hypothetical protein QIA01_04705 [Borreliella americana]WNY64561.1 hypothetical protein QIA00_04700 [Borreliella americana]
MINLKNPKYAVHLVQSKFFVSIENKEERNGAENFRKFKNSTTTSTPNYKRTKGNDYKLLNFNFYKTVKIEI